MGAKILSLFDGMACGMLAMRKAGVEVDEYTAYEIDKYAIQTATHNFPMIKECGDVFKADFTQYKDIDFIVGGSPCTYWSIAQKNNRETEASGLGWELFSQYVRALREVKPKFFIYENNKSMSNAIRESITKTFGFEPICINSALVSAQNRQRLYWVGKRNDDGTYSKVDVKQPEDRGILLKDILNGAIRYSRKTGVSECGDKSLAVCASDWRGINRNQVQNAVIEPVNTTIDGKAQCIRATCYKDSVRNIVGNNIDRKTGVAEPVYVGEIPEHKGQYRNGKQASQQYRVYSSEGKSVCIDRDNRKNIAMPIPYYAEPCEWNENEEPIKAISYADSKTYTVYKVEDGQITIKDKQYPIKLVDGYYIIRKLTVSECKRLQTVPEWYEFPVSDTQSYKMLGNGWTVDVIAHLIETILAEN